MHGCVNPAMNASLPRKICITGSRTIKDRAKVWAILDQYFPRDAILVHGDAKGVDTFAKEWAIANGVAQEGYKPNWKHAGHLGAGMERNQFLIDISQGAIAIWDGQSRGTMDAFNKAKRKGLQPSLFLLRPSGASLSNFLVKPASSAPK